MFPTESLSNSPRRCATSSCYLSHKEESLLAVAVDSTRHVARAWLPAMGLLGLMATTGLASGEPLTVERIASLPSLTGTAPCRGAKESES